MEILDKTISLRRPKTLGRLRPGLSKLGPFFGLVLVIGLFAALLAAGLIEWGKVFVEGADDALNKGYQHRSVMDSSK